VAGPFRYQVTWTPSGKLAAGMGSVVALPLARVLDHVLGRGPIAGEQQREPDQPRTSRPIAESNPRSSDSVDRFPCPDQENDPRSSN